MSVPRGCDHAGAKEGDKDGTKGAGPAGGAKKPAAPPEEEEVGSRVFVAIAGWVGGAPVFQSQVSEDPGTTGYTFKSAEYSPRRSFLLAVVVK